MPTNKPTGFETYVYDHSPIGTYAPRQYPVENIDWDKLPKAECAFDEAPLVMVEPCGSYTAPNDVWLHIKGSNGTSIQISRYCAEQLRDALIKVCEKPIIESS